MSCLSSVSAIGSIPDKMLADHIGLSLEREADFCCPPAHGGGMRLSLPEGWELRGVLPPTREPFPEDRNQPGFVRWNSEGPLLALSAFAVPLPSSCVLGKRRRAGCRSTGSPAYYQYMFMINGTNFVWIDWIFPRHVDSDRIFEGNDQASPYMRSGCVIGDVLSFSDLSPWIVAQNDVREWLLEYRSRPSCTVYRELKCQGDDGSGLIVFCTPEKPIEVSKAIVAQKPALEGADGMSLYKYMYESPLAWASLALFVPFAWGGLAYQLDHAAPSSPEWLLSAGWPFYSFALLDGLPLAILAGSIYGSLAFMPYESETGKYFRIGLLSGAIALVALSRIVAMITIIRLVQSHNKGWAFEIGIEPLPAFQGLHLQSSFSF